MISLKADTALNGAFQSLMPDLSPLIDILFILIVFFLLSIAPQVSTLDLQLPAGDYAAPADDKPQLLLEITSSHYAVNGQRMTTLDEMKAALLRAVRKRPDLPVVLAADRRLSVQKLLPVLSALRAQGVVAASIVMRAGSDMLKR